MSNPLRIAVLISGSGTTLRNLLEKIAADELAVDVKLVVSSSPTAGGLQYARDANISELVVERKKCADGEAFSAAIFSACRDAEVELVVMGGFLKHVMIPGDFANRVINIHPSLIPNFSGQGMYGQRVHQAVLDAGVEKTGCTIHFVDNQYDHGPILLQREVPVEAGDTAETLAQRVFATECEAYPEALGLIAAGRVTVEDRQVTIQEE